MRTDFTIAQYGDWETVATFVAQRLLNDNMDPNDTAAPLREDGQFGDKTYQAVKKFQERVFTRKSEADGIVGPKTFEKLGLRMHRSWSVRLRAQPSKGLCWAAAASMMLGGRMPGPGEAKTNYRGALVDTDANVELFGDSLDWEFLPARSTMEVLAARLTRAPLWLGGDSLTGTGKGDSIHAVVLAGMYLYDWAGQTWMLLKIYDPFPNSRGRIIFMQQEAPRLPDKRKFVVQWILAPNGWTP